jgi:hypothetical protein
MFIKKIKLFFKMILDILSIVLNKNHWLKNDQFESLISGENTLSIAKKSTILSTAFVENCGKVQNISNSAKI